MLDLSFNNFSILVFLALLVRQLQQFQQLHCLCVHQVLVDCLQVLILHRPQFCQPPQLQALHQNCAVQVTPCRARGGRDYFTFDNATSKSIRIVHTSERTSFKKSVAILWRGSIPQSWSCSWRKNTRKSVMMKCLKNKSRRRSRRRGLLKATSRVRSRAGWATDTGTVTTTEAQATL